MRGFVTWGNMYWLAVAVLAGAFRFLVARPTHGAADWLAVLVACVLLGFLWASLLAVLVVCARLFVMFIGDLRDSPW
ncbi:MAG: hypothetical protein OXJ37_08645 [Bryobacterales bacterium]|nr:hypothetical protein [Bryobacterales bacterium]